jgi:ankyrin repeat protein
MFPNPHDALPLPPDARVETHWKLSRKLVAAAKADDKTAVADWLPAGRLAEFASRKLLDHATLARAQFVIARCYGFKNWPALNYHLRLLAHSTSVAARFEAAVDAIVSGDTAALHDLLRADPRLTRAWSTRRHGATLLIYTAANGVEQYRQKTPPNIVEIAETLLNAGADVNAVADLYRNGCATLELVATSVHPREAGVQQPLMELLLARGASIAKPTLISACLGNGHPKAAEFLAARGAVIDLPAAAGLGHLDTVKSLYHTASPNHQHDALFWASEYGQNHVVEFLLEKGADLTAHRADGQTALHWAIIGGQFETVKLLLRHNPPLKQPNIYGGTALGQAVWSSKQNRDPEPYLKIIAALTEAGAM